MNFKQTVLQYNEKNDCEINLKLEKQLKLIYKII